MRKLLIIYGTIILSMCLYAKNLTLKEIINEFDKNSSYTKIEGIEKSKLAIEKKGLFYDEHMKISLNAAVTHYYYGDESKKPSINNLVKYPGSYSLNVGYDFVTIGLSYDLSTDKLKTTSMTIGLSKTMNDFFYSTGNYNNNIFAIKERQIENTLKSMRYSKLEEIIDTYTKIKNIEIEIKLRKKQFEETTAQFNIFIEKEKINEAVKLDTEYVSIESDNEREEIIALENNLISEKKRLAEQVKLKYDEFELEELDVIEAEIKVNDYELKNKVMEIETERENIKYYERQNQITVTPTVNYDIESSKWNARLTIYGALFSYNSESKIKAKSVERLLVEKADIEKEMELNKKQKEEISRGYIEKLGIYRNKYENRKKRFEVIKQMNEKGYITYLNYLKESRFLHEAELGYEKIKNEFSGYKWKMKVAE